MEEGWSVFKIFTGKPRIKRPVGWPRRRWKENITMNLTEIVVNMRNLIHLSQSRNYWRTVVNGAFNL